MPHRPHLAFVLEQTLGHIAHTANLRAALADDPAAAISWLPIAYDAHRRLSRLPLPLNWTVTASLMARRQALKVDRRRPVDAFFFHTQVTALGALKAAGAAGLLLGLLGVRFIGVAAAAGLVLFFIGAVAAHIRARVYHNIAFPGGYLGLAAASLVLAAAR